MQPEHTICRECGADLLPGTRHIQPCAKCSAEAKVKRAALEAKAAAFHANATRYRRRATLQRNPHERAYWDHAAALATKRAEEFEAELKQLGPAP